MQGVLVLLERRHSIKAALAGAALLGVGASAAPSVAATNWTDWGSATPGAPGSASGTLAGVTVSYTGQVLTNTVTGGTSDQWAPESSFTGGTVTDSPSAVGDIIFLDGQFAGTNTVTFSSPVTDPLFAIWSLGRFNLNAFFDFDAAPTFQAGGPSLQGGGGPIIVVGEVVSGLEGNGVVQFTGTFSAISWTNSPESFFGFTVGAVPEPASVVLLGGGLIALGFAARRAPRVGGRSAL